MMASPQLSRLVTRAAPLLVNILEAALVVHLETRVEVGLDGAVVELVGGGWKALPTLPSD